MSLVTWDLHTRVYFPGSPAPAPVNLGTVAGVVPPRLLSAWWPQGRGQRLWSLSPPPAILPVAVRCRALCRGFVLSAVSAASLFPDEASVREDKARGPPTRLLFLAWSCVLLGSPPTLATRTAVGNPALLPLAASLTSLPHGPGAHCLWRDL